ncbi:MULTISPECIES: ADP-dependent glucokinase/phosphofructokinase [unclassified Microbacterium]|uniref:ADP-dependent glucokinase/phosphofructokinase n=1 Tax=Microbacterium TaxID=33882 RepID=UPI003BA2CC61
MGADLVLGLGGTVDYEIRWDTDVVNALVAELGIVRAELTADEPIVDERTLVAAILAFAAVGRGGERFVASSEVVGRFAARFSTSVTLGGTGVRAGLALDRLGVPSTQHLVSIDDTVRRLLPSSMRVVSSATRDTLDPHLIVQYPAGARIRLADGEVVTPSANRLIFANDPPNREMAIADGLGDALATAAVFLVSGFNTMQDDRLLVRRLDELRSAMRRLPSDAVVYYEDAGFYRREFSREIRARLLDRIDVYGMNEDELQEYLGRSVDLHDGDDVVVALRDIHRLIPAPALAVHTRTWAVAVGPEAERYRDALESAVRIAATRYRLGDGFSPSDLDATDRCPRHQSGALVVDQVRAAIPGSTGIAGFDIDTSSPTTIGLGDTFVGGFLSAFAPARRAAA